MESYEFASHLEGEDLRLGSCLYLPMAGYQVSTQIAERSHCCCPCRITSSEDTDLQTPKMS